MMLSLISQDQRKRKGGVKRAQATKSRHGRIHDGFFVELLESQKIRRKTLPDLNGVSKYYVV